MEKEERVKPNRSALWLLVGVVVGFGLPIAALIALVMAAVSSAASLDTRVVPSSGELAHVSGPRSGPAVVLVDIVGPIVSGTPPLLETAQLAASGRIVPLIRQVAVDDEVKALVLRVNCPGGSVVGTDEIYHVLRETEKPIVVLMKEVAASGAYYLSMAADHLVANQNTITGSIGVMGQFPNVQGLMEKVGFAVNTFKSGEAKDLGSPFREMTREERALFQDIVDETFERFVAIVMEGRGLSEAKVRELADGRVYTGQKALEVGLVDAVGYERDAIAKAAELGGIEGEARVVHCKKESTVLEMLIGSGGGGPGRGPRGLDAAAGNALPGVPVGAMSVGQLMPHRRRWLTTPTPPGRSRAHETCFSRREVRPDVPGCERRRRLPPTPGVPHGGLRQACRAHRSRS